MRNFQKRVEIDMQLEMPCERMHLAYSTSPPPEGEPPVATAAAAAVVVVPRLATPPLGEPPPLQPAARSEHPTTATSEVRVSGRRQRMMFGFLSWDGMAEVGRLSRRGLLSL